MSNFFDPSNQKETTQTTPSPADQAAAKFRADLLGQLLNASARPKPTFAQYAGGQGYPQMPGGLGGGIADVLSAMAQPGAFTSTQTGVLQPSAPSMFSDLLQGGLTGALLMNALSGSGAGSWLVDNILKPLGGRLQIPGLGSDTPLNAEGQDVINAATNIASGVGSASAGAPLSGGIPLDSGVDTSGIDPAILDALLNSNWY